MEKQRKEEDKNAEELPDKKDEESKSKEGELNDMERMEYQRLMELKREKQNEEKEKQEQTPEIQQIINENNQIKEKVKQELEQIETDEDIKKMRNNILDPENDVELFQLDPDEQEALNSRNIQTGGEFKLNKEKIKQECSNIKMNRLIFPHQLRMLSNCFDNN